MERHCSGCGARISDDMKICGNCGKIIPSQRTRQEVKRPTQNSVNRPKVVREAPQKNSVPKRDSRKSPTYNKQSIRQENFESVKKHKNTKSKHSIKKWIKVAFVVLAVYLVVSLVQIFRVRMTGYEFKQTDMKMSQHNFGQAVDNFFDSGHWVYNPFTFTVKYSGETADGYEYDLKFSAFASVKVKEVQVDGEKKTDSKMESALMGMFI